MAATRRIGILTGGGDVPGLNSVIKSVVYRSTALGYEIFGIRRGWEGLTHLSPGPVLDSDYVRRLDRVNTRTIDRTGGTWLHTSRTNPRKMRGSALPAWLDGNRRAELATDEDDVYDLTPVVLDNIARLGIDVLVTIGGDDTLSFSRALVEQGIPLVAIPKTMDNDVHGTDYCIGFSTAITRTVIFIHQLRTSAGSHERLAVVEVFGRYSGETSLVSSYLSGVERAVISEVPFDIEKLAAKLLEDKRANPSGYAMMTISEGATMVGGETVHAGMADAYGHLKLGGIGQVTGEALREITGEGIIYQQVGYLMRSGSPDSLDLMVAINYAVMAADLVIERQFGRLVALRNGNYTNVPLPVLRQGVKRVDVGALYDVEAYRPKIRHVDGKPMFLY
jgi:6-phosphofructokinase